MPGLWFQLMSPIMGKHLNVEFIVISAENVATCLGFAVHSHVNKITVFPIISDVSYSHIVRQQWHSLHIENFVQAHNPEVLPSSIDITTSPTSLVRMLTQL